MKNIKNILIVCLAIITASIFITGCGNDTAEEIQKTEDADDSSLAESVTGSADNEASGDTTNPVELQYSIKKYDYSIDGYDLYVEYPMFDDSQYADLNTYFESKGKLFSEGAMDYINMYENNDATVVYHLTEDFVSAYTYGDYICVVNRYSQFAGGVNPNDYSIYLFDMNNAGEPIHMGYGIVNEEEGQFKYQADEKIKAFSTILGMNNTTDIRNYVSAVTLQYLKDNDLYDDYTEPDDISTTHSCVYGCGSYTTSFYDFYFDENGVYAYFQQYEILPGADGDISILLSDWNDLPTFSTSAISLSCICPYSSEREITEEGITAYLNADYSSYNFPGNRSVLQMMINEIYAKYICVFEDRELVNYFSEKFPYYKHCTEGASDGAYANEIEQYYLTDIERKNIEILKNAMENQ